MRLIFRPSRIKSYQNIFFMVEQVYNFSLDVTWQLIQRMSSLDRFDAQWATIE